ncbi:MAG: hypothetical protein AB9888_12670 [Bacteroidales bacterium]
MSDWLSSNKQWKPFLFELQNQILPVYRAHEQNFDWYGIHGRMHICRALMFAESMARQYEAAGECVDYFAVRMATAFHDSGREGNGPDLWEDQSARLCTDYISLHYPEEGKDYAVYVGQLIMKRGAHDLSWRLVHDADVLEIMRPTCGHGGFWGFRRNALRFAGEKDPNRTIFEQPDDLRDQFIRQAWDWILLTEENHACLRQSVAFMDDLLGLLTKSVERFPLLRCLVDYGEK